MTVEEFGERARERPERHTGHLAQGLGPAPAREQPCVVEQPPCDGTELPLRPVTAPVRAHHSRGGGRPRLPVQCGTQHLRPLPSGHPRRQAQVAGHPAQVGADPGGLREVVLPRRQTRVEGAQAGEVEPYGRHAGQAVGVQDGAVEGHGERGHRPPGESLGGQGPPGGGEDPRTRTRGRGQRAQ